MNSPHTLPCLQSQWRWRVKENDAALPDDQWPYKNLPELLVFHEILEVIAATRQGFADKAIRTNGAG